MTLSRGTWVRAVGATGVTSADARRADAANYYHDVAGTVRSGLLWTSTMTLVQGQAGWSYSVPAFPGFVIGRAANEGCYTMSGQGATTVATGVAPAAGLSRWDLIYLKQNDTEKGDADNNPVLGVTQGTAAAAPTKPVASVPTGAVIIAEAQIFSATTGTSASPNTITQLWKYTALQGNPIPVRNASERPTTPRINDEVIRLDISLGSEPAIEWFNGTAWVPRGIQYAEYYNSWAHSGGLASWDCGPLVETSANTWANTFASRAGALSGAVNILESGIYSVTFQCTPTAAPAKMGLFLKNAGGITLASDFSDGTVWEVTASFTRYLPAGSYIRGVTIQQNATSVITTATLYKHEGTWRP